ncbi:hypothetical protein H2204_005818 [Knufia peltigerae]|uniref:Xylanolytic transcriptional activator regulatory domain-containing protein n=1 Tax=Knufia peltigerae TaxID=1002370 RepID=A0AA38Y572_9EURO|nr:hypothetical protein H2204_005818 [Knufia peltigerae]
MGRQCNFLAPVRGKRRRTKLPREGLHARLKRYEKILESYGAKLERPEYENDIDDLETTTRSDSQGVEAIQPPSQERRGVGGLDESRPLLITNEGESRYLDGTMWFTLGHESQDPQKYGLDAFMDGSDIQDSDLAASLAEQHGLLLENDVRFGDVASLHPPVNILPKFQEVYTDRVDPLLKILHLRTFWPLLTEVVREPRKVSNILEALVLSFYLITISFLEEAECISMLNTQKSILYTRYRIATRQALINAQFLSSSNLRILQAYAMFMWSARSSYRCDTLFSLSGVAIRLARKMGLHRDGSLLGLSPFETEMRRRLWWHLFSVDFRICDIMGFKPSMDLLCCDTQMPLNVPDEDLWPEMVASPPARHGITSMTFCLIRCEVIEFLRNLNSSLPGRDGWDIFVGADFTVARKESLICQIEDLLERKYLRYCDPFNSLHNLVSVMARWTICRLRLFAHNPRRYIDSSIPIPQRERDIVFTTASSLLDYASMAPDNPSLKKYRWRVHVSYLWNIVLHILIETRHRKQAPEVDRVWKLIGVVFSKYPQFFEKSTAVAYTALSKWVLEVWDNYVDNMHAASLPSPSTPEYISAMRRGLMQSRRAENVSDLRVSIDSSHTAQTVEDLRNCQSRKQDGNLNDFESFSDILSFERSLDEWLHWEQLVAEEGGFSPPDAL